MITRAERRARNERAGKARQKQYKQQTYRWDPEDIRETSLWRFSKRPALGCEHCRNKRHGNPKLGCGICSDLVRESVKLRRKNRKLCRDWLEQLEVLDPEDIEL